MLSSTGEQHKEQTMQRHDDCDHCANREDCDRDCIEVDSPDCFFDDTLSDPEPREDNFRDDVEADADALAGAGYGTDEDYEHPDCDDDGFAL
jgi:hypothetical protein